LPNKKLTYEFVKESFEKDGYMLVSNEYIDCKTKLNYKCHNEHEHSIIWSNWNKGIRCPYCSGKAKYTLEQVRESFERDNYILLSKEYINDCTKLYYRCSNNHKHSIVWNAWQRGQRCPVCDGNVKLTLEQVKKSFNNEGYTLLSKEYVNSIVKLDYICSNGHNHSIKWGHWQQGKRCPTCSVIKHTGSGNPYWKGGISFEPYCPIWKDKEYKQDIRERDGNRCLNPYCNSKKSNDLSVHHIDYDKKNCKPDNLITICRSCNCMANKDREWHKTWYQAIIQNRYYSRSPK
jgi:hypothetical protein